MYWHTLETEEIPDIYEFEAQIRSKTGLISEIEYRYRSTYFNHIFAEDIQLDITATRGLKYLMQTHFKHSKRLHYSTKRLLTNSEQIS